MILRKARTGDGTIALVQESDDIDSNLFLLLIWIFFIELLAAFPKSLPVNFKLSFCICLSITINSSGRGKGWSARILRSPLHTIPVNWTTCTVSSKISVSFGFLCFKKYRVLKL